MKIFEYGTHIVVIRKSFFDKFDDMVFNNVEEMIEEEHFPRSGIGPITVIFIVYCQGNQTMLNFKLNSSGSWEMDMHGQRFWLDFHLVKKLLKEIYETR